MENILVILIVIAWVAGGIWVASGWEENKKLSLAEKVFGFLSLVVLIVLLQFIGRGKV